MVHLLGINNPFLGKPRPHPLLLSLLPPVTDSGPDPPCHVELDFSDLFGPLSAEDNDPTSDPPPAVCNRTRSLVGPTKSVGSPLALSRLTLDEESSDNSEPEEDQRREMTGDDVKRGGSKAVGLHDFVVMKLVGQGAFGKVYQVNRKGSSEIYAMKVIRKDKIMEKNHAGYMKAERDILTIIDHPFIIQLRYSFQTKYRLYLVLDFINGGHLFFQLYHHGLFREDLARVYAAEIVSAVSHLHNKGIMHRDLKPENILLDADGHAMLTDFGLAKQFDDNTRANSMCGTVEYMAPEIILGKGHDKAADWWSVGILLFEMLTGKLPFCGGNRHKIQQKIAKDKIKLPSFLTSEAHSILKELLQKEVGKRLGSGEGGGEEVRGHRWFKGINWVRLEKRLVQPGFIPDVAGKHCVANFDKRWTEMPLNDSPISSPIPSDVFNGFSYVRPPISSFSSP